MDRREFMRLGGVAAGASLLARTAAAHGQAVASAQPVAAAADGTTPPRAQVAAPGGQIAVVTPNGSTLPWRVVDGVKVGHLIAEPVEHEFAPGLRARCWGYNGSTPGPTIEAGKATGCASM